MDDFLIWVARGLSFWLDKIIYGFIPTVYNLFTDIAQTTIFSTDILSLFSSRVYSLLGIFMLFKVSFSILTYIVDPDAFLDKSKGFGKLIGNVLITLVLLVLTPWIFKQAMEIQTIILENNVIGKLFTVSNVNTNVVSDPGNTMAYETFNAFYHLDTTLSDSCNYTGEGTYEDFITGCVNSLKINDTDAAENLKQNLKFSYNTNSISVYMDSSFLYLKDQNDNYVMNYIPIISTLAGGAIVLLLIVFCFDIAVRSIKLGFLRMLAPIPIISRIDPKKGKEVFDKWLKTCINTYLDLFIRLLAIYFAIFVITQVISLETYDAVTESRVSVSAFVKVFIILGALLFAKQLPKLIEEITGVKMDGKFTLNPMSKLRQVPLAGAAVTTAAALAGGAYTGYKAGVEAGHAGRGMWLGLMGAGRDIKGKVSLMGDDKGGKSPRAFYSGMQSGYKEITGKDYSQYSFWKNRGQQVGKDEIGTPEKPGLKQYKYALQGEQAKLDAELQSLYDQLTKTTNPARKDALNAQIKENRETYGKYAKHISSLDDQIKDIKRLYHIDDSPKKDVTDAVKAAKEIMGNDSNSGQSTPSAPPTHGPNGRGDPVPGQPNPNTSQKKQQRRNNN